MSDEPRHRFSRSMRLQRRHEFVHLREKGQRLAQGCLILNWLPRTTGSHSRLGVVTSAKVGSAVIRSRARRLLREAFRKRQHELVAPMDMVLVARLSIVGKSAADVERDYLRALDRARIRNSGP